ncbi:hypothetical protein EV702DRAFT_1134778 [Suillus placidus]|uniref:Secreted protein n=1 Tax=Suillus placidus TaxID=48579 RepID=A0A9P6ZM94_9AGAM|nr:hypothetical protein EV702DRAFT_1134778 [Suillus placidus]
MSSHLQATDILVFLFLMAQETVCVSLRLNGWILHTHIRIQTRDFCNWGVDHGIMIMVPPTNFHLSSSEARHALRVRTTHPSCHLLQWDQACSSVQTKCEH